MLEREPPERLEEGSQLRRDELEPVAHQDEIRVVGDVAARGAEVDDRFGRGALLAVVGDVGHDVVAEVVLDRRDALEIDVVAAAAHLRDRLGRDGKPRLGLALGQGDPEVAPGPITATVREDLEHLGARVAVREGISVSVFFSRGHEGHLIAGPIECQEPAHPITEDVKTSPRPARTPLILLLSGAAMLLLPARRASGDTITLQNGNEIHGEIIEETPQRITIRFIGGTMVVNRREVKAVRREGRLDFLLSQGESSLKRDNPESAVEIFGKAREEFPESVPAREGLAAAEERLAQNLESSGLLGAALRAFQKIQERDPSHPRASEAMQRIVRTIQRAVQEEKEALELLRKGNVDEARTRLLSLHERFPERRPALTAPLARSLIACGDRLLPAGGFQEAQRFYLDAIALDPDLVPAMAPQFAFARAKEIFPLAEQGKFDPLLERADEGLQVAGQQPILVYLRGVALQGLGRKHEAAEAFLRVSGVDRPPNPRKVIDSLRTSAEEKLTGGATPSADRAAEDDRRRKALLPGNYRQRETDHFVIHHRNDQVASEVATAAEDAYERLYQELGCKGQWHQKCRITLYPTKEEFTAATGIAGWSGGAHQIRRKFGALSDHHISSYQLQPRLTGSTIPHEVAHAMLAFRLGYRLEPPTWLNEGFAVQWEPAYVHRYYQRIAADAARARTLIPLSRLLGLKGYPEREDEVNLFYAQSFVLVSILLDERKIEVFLDFAEELSGSPESIDRLFERHYKIRGVKAIENRLVARLTN